MYLFNSRIAILAISLGFASMCSAQLVINEVDYDNTGTDDHEFIEIKNVGASTIDLSGHTVQLYDGSAALPTAYSVITLPSIGLAPGAYLVICSDPTKVFPCDVDAAPDADLIQDGAPDAIALVDGVTLLDAVSYEGDTVSFVEGSGVGLEDFGAQIFTSISRFPDGVDTDVNNVDFSLRCATPGQSNSAAMFDCLPPPGPLVINEVDYDQPSADTAEFIEIKNIGSTVVNLGGHTVQLYNGAPTPATAYVVVTLPSIGLLPGDYFVICGDPAVVVPCDVDAAPDTNLIQNGAPDAIALVRDTTLLDIVSYEGDTAFFTEGSGVGLIDDPATANKSISRCADGVDTNQNNVDFTYTDASPGASNVCAPPPVPVSVVINEIDADTAGTDTAEFIELFGDPFASLDGVVLVLFNGNGDLSYNAFDLDGFTTDADGFFLLGNPAVPGVQITFPGNGLQNGADAVALYQGDAADFPNGTPPTTDNLLDALVYDTNDADDPELLSILTPGQPQVNEGGNGDKDNHSIARVPDGGDPFDTSAFVPQAPTPAMGNEPPPPPPIGTCGEAANLIHLIQGNGFTSPVVGMDQIIEGVVVGDFQGVGALNGFFVQEEDSDNDADPATSEGLFVFDTNVGVDVNVGDIVRVGGTVVESFGLTQLSSVTGVETCATGASASAATVTLPLVSTGDLEVFEGMLVHFPQELFATGNFTQGRFGEVDLSVGERLSLPTNVAAPGAPALAVQDLNNRSRILLDDGSGTQNPLPLPPYLGIDGTLRAGDAVTGVTGALSFAFGSYRVHPTEMVLFDRLNDRPTEVPDVGGTLTVASFNVLNYFTTLDDSGPICGPLGNLGCRGADTVDEFERQRAKTLSALSTLNADVVGLIEVENNPVESVMDLVKGLNDLLGPGTYDFIDSGTVGGDAIKVALIYKPAVVSPIGNSAVLDDVFPFNTNTRPPLAQAFEENSTGRGALIVVNHFKSKGSACDAVPNPDTGTDFIDPDTGDGQGNCNLTRVEAADRLLEWLGTDPTSTGIHKTLVIGDLNAYAQEHPVLVFESEGFTDLVEKFGGAYSFVFRGEAGYLDHALASGELLPFVSGVAEWHINADEPSALDYNNFNQPLLYSPDAFRSSDHDPILIGLDLQPMIQVDIDIRPLFRRNFINPRRNAPIAVAILSDVVFDARDVDPSTVRFGPAGAAPRWHPIFVDLNHDRRKDLVLFFRTRHTGIQCGDTEASITGFTFDGTKFDGSDSIRTIGCRRRHHYAF